MKWIKIKRHHYLKGKDLFITLLFWNVFSFPANAQPGQVHIGLTRTDNTQDISVIFTTEKEIHPQYIFYGNSPESGKKKKATSSEFNNISVHEVVLKRLPPGRKIVYRCGSEQTGWSPAYTFKTAPKPGSTGKMTVGIIGDTQNNEFNLDFEKTAAVVSQLKTLNPDLVLHMGDIVNNGSVDDDWIRILGILQPLTATSPLMVALGNHDVENKAGPSFQQPFPSFTKLFSMPGKNPDYSFNYGNVHFVCLFSGVASQAAGPGLLRYGDGSPELKWLENDLRIASSKKEYDWIVVFMHYPLYSFGWSNVSAWKERMTPVLDKYGVDLCLAGHRHVYERHFPVKDGKAVAPGMGTVYITNGTAGGSPQGTGGAALPTMAYTPAVKTYNFAVMTIENKCLQYRVFDLTGNKTDEFTLKKNQ